MKKISLILLLFLIAYSLQLTAYSQEEAFNPKRAVMIIAHENFRDEELLEPKRILEENSIQVKVASSSVSTARGMLGAEINPDTSIKDIKAEDFDVIIFVGGAGASEYWDDPVAQKLAQDAVSQDKLVASICLAPVTLANAGVLKDKRATVWPSEAGRIKAQGAIYSASAVEKDGNIITGSGPEAATEFGREIVKILSNK